MSFYGGADLTTVRFLIPVGAVTFDDIDKVTEIIEQTLVKMAENP